MGMSMDNGSRAGEPEVMMEINITPLIDVMLVLLIMLIITIPVQLHSVNLDMPQSSAAPKKQDPVIVRLEVDAGNGIRWNGQPVHDREALDARMQEAGRLQPQPEIHIRADARTQYATVAAVLASAQRHGLGKLGIVGVERFSP